MDSHHAVLAAVPANPQTCLISSHGNHSENRPYQPQFTINHTPEHCHVCPRKPLFFLAQKTRLSAWSISLERVIAEAPGALLWPVPACRDVFCSKCTTSLDSSMSTLQTNRIFINRSPYKGITNSHKQQLHIIRTSESTTAYRFHLALSKIQYQFMKYITKVRLFISPWGNEYLLIHY